MTGLHTAEQCAAQRNRAAYITVRSDDVRDVVYEKGNKFHKYKQRQEIF
jgi:hypothetical protein